MTKKQKKKLLEAILVIIITIISIYFTDSEEPKQVTSQNRETEEVINISDNNNLKVHYIDVGQADSILIEQNNEYMLIDAGNNEDGKKLVKYFKDLGINNFKNVIATHAHEDHIGGMDDIINNFSVENFYMPEAITTTKTFEDVLDALENKQVAFQTPKIDEELKFAKTKLKVLNLENDESDLNDTSIVVRLKYGTTSFLFMGDASSNIEKKILNKDIKSDVLKTGHHGSRYSNSLTFLKKVEPTYAIISVGEANSYNHPHTEIINRLNNLNIKTYRTDKDGTIIAESNGTIINFSTKKTDTNG